jgi:hypothetical protein
MKNVILASALVLLCACTAFAQDVTFTYKDNLSPGQYGYAGQAYCPDGTPFAHLDYLSTRIVVTGQCHYTGDVWEFVTQDQAEAWVRNAYAKEQCTGQVQHCYYAGRPSIDVHIVP